MDLLVIGIVMSQKSKHMIVKIQIQQSVDAKEKHQFSNKSSQYEY